MKTIITILFIMCSTIVSAQEKTTVAENKKITGVITDSEGIPVSGVSIKVEGTSEGVLTDFDGNYTINAKEGEKLVASFDGMTQETITVNKQNTIDFKLREDPEFMKKTVWNGKCYGPYTKTTAIASENTGNVKMLEGNTVIVKDGCIAGQSGTMSVLRCYGSINGPSEPMYIIDGVPLNADHFRKLNPDDIISINVLKDAGATSIYGNRGIDGVIIVKTKNGLTRKEKRRMRREQKKKDKTQTN